MDLKRLTDTFAFLRAGALHLLSDSVSGDTVGSGRPRESLVKISGPGGWF